MTRQRVRYLVLIIGLGLGLASSGCSERDNPLDPGRCVPACAADETCLEGTCVAADGGQTDMAPDGGVPDSALSDSSASDADLGAADLATGDGGGDAGVASYAMTSKKCAGNIYTTGSTSTPIACSGGGGNFEAQVTANGKDRYLFILNVPDTWVDVEYAAAVFRIVAVDATSTETLIASGKYSGRVNQRIPITITGTSKLPAGTHTIRAKWALYGGGKLNIGVGGAWLVILPSPDADLQSIHGPAQKETTPNTTNTYTDLTTRLGAPLEIKTKSQAGQYLIIFNAPATSMVGKGQPTSFHIVVDEKLTGKPKSVAYGAYTCDYLTQYIPMTLIGTAQLDVGDKVRVEWRANAKAGYIDKATGGANATWLIALRTPKGLDRSGHSSGTPLATTTTSKINGLSSFDVVGSGGDHLFILNVTDSWTNLYKQYAAHYAIKVAGQQEFIGYVSSATSGTSQYMPVTVIGVKKLPFVGNKSKVEAWWGVMGCPGCTATLKLRMIQLISLTR